jgi:hypothetical protein
MFAQAINGANAREVLSSVIETAKTNGLVAFDYLMHLLPYLSLDLPYYSKSKVSRNCGQDHI